MSYLAFTPNQARAPFAEILPDGRKRLTRWFKATTIGTFPRELDYAVNTADPLATEAPTGWTALRLTYKQMDDDARGFPQGAEDSQALVRLIYEEISETGETRVGANEFTQLPDGRHQVIQRYVMFESSSYTPQVPGTTQAAGLAGYYLWTEEAPDDGTLRNITRTYQTAGTTAQDDESLQGGALLIRKITSFKTVPATPSGYTSVGTPVQNPNGYPIYTYTFAKGDGLVLDEKNISASAALVVYHRISLGSAPSTPSATIGGTVTLFETSLKNADGYDIYDYRWAEGDGQANITTRGEADGSIVYTVTDYAASATTPSYPGAGSNTLVSLTQKPENGYFVNTAVYVKWPASQDFRKMVKFLYPGLASFSGAPVLYSLIPPVTMDILATVTVDYGTTQITTTPFTVSAYAKLNVSWIPYTNPGVSPTPGSPPADTTTGPPQGYTESLGGYLAGASGISDTDEYFNGVFVASYSATLSASTPSSRPSGATTIAVDNDPYLVSTSGTVVYRRTVTTYTF